MAAETAGRWTGVSALRSQSLRSWERGDLLRELLQPTAAYPRRRTLKHPTANELRSDYAAARGWAAEIRGSADFTVETTAIGRTTIGTNEVPSAVVFDSVANEIAFVGKTRPAKLFLQLTAQLSELHPVLETWAGRRPLKVLELGADALTAARVALWLVDNPSPDIYLRQLSLPGVHTKFVEHNRRSIDDMTTALLLASGQSAAPGSATGADFAARHGFRTQPGLVRFRMLDPAVPLIGGARDLMVTAGAFAGLDLPVRTVIVTENLVNFLALPEQPGALALFGSGYGFSALQEAAWLRDCTVLYWGDLDTHGFKILDQLRGVHPHVESLMMDTATLLAHREFWGQETSPSQTALTRLTGEEETLYKALGSDDHGPSVRLEQEHIQWDWVLDRLDSTLR